MVWGSTRTWITIRRPGKPHASRDPTHGAICSKERPEMHPTTVLTYSSPYWPSPNSELSLAVGSIPCGKRHELSACPPRRLGDLVRAAGHGLHSRMTVGPKRAVKGRDHSRVRLRHRDQVCLQPIQEIEPYFVVAALARDLGHTRVGMLAVVDPNSIREINRRCKVKLH